MISCPVCMLMNTLDVDNCACCQTLLPPSERIRQLLDQVKSLKTQLVSDSHNEINQCKTTVINVNAKSLRALGYKSIDAWFAASPNHVYIGRAMPAYQGKSAIPGSVWGNPFKIGRDGTREDVVTKYHAYITAKIGRGELNIKELQGKTLGCWCSPEACHGDVLATLSNK
ncbi:hypothetical protein THRCLA_06936 [Thraustotheca clavata]|uniref:DUF4326 domain-containing protein n=1 Tax=Thraustotheca clavata TaxID=74557 RepID=A0A1V9ZHL1_9STRA|nr:hypothetical protein THRCLA_06936 [Thraustotheca clavata]